jgi:hypothetical protein
MFIGHLALALATKKATPRTSLATLVFATTWCDLLWPFLLLLGWERVSLRAGATAFNPLVFDSYPWSHSLLLVTGWAALIGGLHWLVRKDRRAALILGLLVLSHWLLDWISHRPDMPLWPGGTLHGLGLWNHVGATVLVEGALFVAGVLIYLRATRAPSWKGQASLWSFLILLAFMYAGDASGGAPPPNVQVLNRFAFLGWLLPLWGMWIERTRTLA